MKRSNSFRWRLLPVVVVLLALPVTAGAHATITGVGHFVGGLLHPFTVPAHILLLLGLGLLAGQRSPLNLKTPLLAFAPVLAVALGLTLTAFVTSVYPPLLTGLALIVGGLVALGRPLPPMAIAVIFAAAALALGLDSAVETGTTGAIVKTLLGTALGLLLAVTDLALYVSYVNQKPWQKIGIRVAGSWITAASMMILAFAFRR